MANGSKRTSGKRAQPSNALREKKCRFTAGQVRRIGAMAELPAYEGVDEASRIRFVLNAGFNALGVTDPEAPAVAGRIGPATGAQPLLKAA